MSEEIVLIYDKECPVCDNYCQVVRIRESVGRLVIVNARQDSELMRELTGLGLDIDQGMVLKMGNQLYFGADAIHALALISSRSGLFNKLNYYIFRSRTVSAWLYPVLRSCRNLLLRFKGVSKINNLRKQNNEKF